MLDITVQLDGMDKLKAALQAEPQKAAVEISKAVQKSILTLQSNAMKQAPVNKQSGGGNLRQSIRSRMISVFRGEVTTNVSYAAFVELGTRPHTINVVNKKVLANKRTGQFFGKVVHHPGTRANPFMQRAIDLSKEKVNEFFQTAIQNIFNTFK